MKRLNDKNIIKTVKQHKLYLEYRILVNALVKQYYESGKIPRNSLTQDFIRSFKNNNTTLLLKTLSFVQANKIEPDKIYKNFTYQWKYEKQTTIYKNTQKL